MFDSIETDELWIMEHEDNNARMVRDGEGAIEELLNSRIPRVGTYISMFDGDVSLLLQLSSGPRTYAYDDQDGAKRAMMIILQRISVKPSRRRKGLAERALKELSAEATRRGFKLMIQSVISSEMEKLLKKMGAARIPYDESSYVLPIDAKSWYYA